MLGYPASTCKTNFALASFYFPRRNLVCICALSPHSHKGRESLGTARRCCTARWIWKTTGHLLVLQKQNLFPADESWFIRQFFWQWALSLLIKKLLDQIVKVAAFCCVISWRCWCFVLLGIRAHLNGFVLASSWVCVWSFLVQRGTTWMKLYKQIWISLWMLPKCLGVVRESLGAGEQGLPGCSAMSEVKVSSLSCVGVIGEDGLPEPW